MHLCDALVILIEYGHSSFVLQISQSWIIRRNSYFYLMWPSFTQQHLMAATISFLFIKRCFMVYNPSILELAWNEQARWVCCSAVKEYPYSTRVWVWVPPLLPFLLLANVNVRGIRWWWHRRSLGHTQLLQASGKSTSGWSQWLTPLCLT